MVKKLRFGLIGCGRVCKKHIDSIHMLDQAELVALCDIDEEKAREKARENQIPFYTDYHEMIRKETSLDVISILTDSGSHGKIAIDIAPYQKHIIVEKPMALNLEDADGMIWACDKWGIKLFVVKQNRYNLAVVKLKQTIDEGGLGKIVLGTVRVRWSRDQSYYDLAEWRGTWWGDGGVMANQASHHIDLLEWMVGDVKSVMCMTRTQLVNIETEDTAVALLSFKNGALGVIEATTATRPRDLEGSLSILGEKGAVVVGGFAVNQIDTWNLIEPTSDKAEEIKGYNENPRDVYGFGHPRFYQSVIEALLENTQAFSLVDGLEGKRSLELINALYESAAVGGEVYVGDRPKHSRLGEPRYK